MALHNATSCFCLLLIQGRKYELRYRYETWIQYVSRQPIPRVDLKPLAQQLTQQENSESHWQFDGVEQITPRLHLVGARESQISPESFRRQVTDFLRAAPPAWNPFD
jgi:predicted porin